jgi:hypothetical protein
MIAMRRHWAGGVVDPGDLFASCVVLVAARLSCGGEGGSGGMDAGWAGGGADILIDKVE